MSGNAAPQVEPRGGNSSPGDIPVVRGGVAFWGPLRAFLMKDILREVRTGEMLMAVAAFGLAIMLVLSFALPHGAQGGVRIAAGALWVALLLATQVGIARSVDVERTGGRLETVRSAPVDATLLYLAKAASIFVFVLLAAMVLLMPWVVLFNLDVAVLARVLPVLALGVLGISMAGTLVAFLAAGTRLREILQPILFLTLFIPLLLAAVAATASALSPVDGPPDLRILVGFDLLLGGAAILLAPSLLEE